MIELKIQKGKNKATVWIQDLLIAGKITGENEIDRYVAKVFYKGHNLTEYFKEVELQTGIKFFKQ